MSRVAMMGNSIATRSHIDFANRTTKTSGPISQIVFTNTNPGVTESLPSASLSETLHTNLGKGDLVSWLEQGETNFDIRLEDQVGAAILFQYLW